MIDVQISNRAFHDCRIKSSYAIRTGQYNLTNIIVFSFLLIFFFSATLLSCSGGGTHAEGGIEPDPGPGEPETPEISSIQPSSGPPESMAAIMGSSFGATPEENIVKFDEVEAEIIEVRHFFEIDIIDIIVPASLPPGQAIVTITVGDKVSNGVPFFITLIPDDNIINAIRPEAIGISSSSGKIYTANSGSDSLSIIDTELDYRVKNILVGTAPKDLLVLESTKGVEVYVANSEGNTVSVVDGETGTLVRTLPVGGNPTDIVHLPETGCIYISTPGSETLEVLGCDDPSLDKRIHIGSGGSELALIENLQKVLVVKPDYDSVVLIDASSNTVITELDVGNHPERFAVNKSSGMAYLTNSGGDIGTVTVLDGNSNEVTGTVAVGKYPVGIAILTNPGRIFVANKADDSLSIIDENTLEEVVPPLQVGDGPVSVLADQDLGRVYVANQDNEGNSVSVIDGAASEPKLIDTISTGRCPRDLIVDSSTGNIITANFWGDSISVIDKETFQHNEFPVGVSVDKIFFDSTRNIIYGKDKNERLLKIEVGDRSFKPIELEGGVISAVIDEVSNKAYISLMYSSQLAVYDGSTEEVTYINVGEMPLGLDIDPINSRAYVANYESHNVSVVDTDLLEVIGELDVQRYPLDVKVHKKMDKIYVLNSEGSWVDHGSISIYNRKTCETIHIQLPTFWYPYAGLLGKNESANEVYVAIDTSNQQASDVLIIIDQNDHFTIRQLNGLNPIEIGVNELSHKLYIPLWASNRVAIIDGNNGFSVKTIGAEGIKPSSVATSPINGFAYVPTFESGTLTIINDQDKIVDVIDLGAEQPTDVEVFLPENMVYVSTLAGGGVVVMPGWSE